MDEVQLILLCLFWNSLELDLSNTSAAKEVSCVPNMRVQAYSQKCLLWPLAVGLIMERPTNN